MAWFDFDGEPVTASGLDAELIAAVFFDGELLTTVFRSRSFAAASVKSLSALLAASGSWLA